MEAFGLPPHELQDRASLHSHLPLRVFTSIVLGFGLILRTTTAIATPAIEPDYYCYLQDSNGMVMSLNDICGIADLPPSALLQTTRAAAGGNSIEATALRNENVGASSGLESGIQQIRRLGSSRWSGHTIGRGLYDYERYPARIGGSSGGSSGRGRCNSPTDTALDGSRCGGRAASARPGGN